MSTIMISVMRNEMRAVRKGRFSKNETVLSEMRLLLNMRSGSKIVFNILFTSYTSLHEHVDVFHQLFPVADLEHDALNGDRYATGFF
jgi:hypothetical protein